MVEKITLPNGVRIVCEHIPHVRSVSFGLWLGVGSRYEAAAQNGASHCIEHMLFKGTTNRTAAELAEDMDQLGGQINAFTTKECTCFYGRVLDKHLRRAVDILSDMFFHSEFTESALDAERGIIAEEIDMYEDSPEDLVSDQLMEAVYPNSPLGAPILGTKESLAGLTRASLLDFMETYYVPERLVIAVSGNFTSDDVAYIRSIFAGMMPKTPVQMVSAAYTPAFTITQKPIEQNHLCLLFPGLSMTSEDRYAGQLLSSILGGGMSSRLFQTVREQHGLCYSVYTFGVSYQDCGVFGVYTALNQDTEQRAIGLIMEILHDLRENGVTQKELDRTRDQVSSSVLMSLESTSARMNSLGKNELYRDKIPTPEEIIARYDAVSQDDVRRVAQDLLDFSALSFSAVGQVADEARYRDILK